MQTEQTINKLNSQLMPRWESYMTRRLPLNAPVATQSQTQSGAKLKRLYAQQKLWAMRELLRMDFPDRYTDLLFTPVFLINPTTAGSNPTPYYSDMSRIYQRMIMQATGNTLAKSLTTLSISHASAECLYMIINGNAQDNDLAGNAFTPNEFGDNDNDSMPEFLDAWGNSIEFLRWAPGFNSDLQPVFSISPSDPAANQYPKTLPKDPQTPGNFLSHFPVSYNPYVPVNSTGNNASNMASQVLQYAIIDYHDGFDPLELDPGPGNFPVPERGYNLIPLIVSAGPDGVSGQENYTTASGSPDLVSTSFGLVWGTTTTPATGSNIYNTDDDPYATVASSSSSSSPGSGSSSGGSSGSSSGSSSSGPTQRGSPDPTYGAASYDNIHNHLMRTRP